MADNGDTHWAKCITNFHLSFILVYYFQMSYTDRRVGSFPTLIQLVCGSSHYEGIVALHFSDLQVHVQMVGCKNHSTDFQYYKYTQQTTKMTTQHVNMDHDEGTQ